MKATTMKFAETCMHLVAVFLLAVLCGWGAIVAIALWWKATIWLLSSAGLI